MTLLSWQMPGSTSCSGRSHNRIRYAQHTLQFYYTVPLKCGACTDQSVQALCCLLCFARIGLDKDSDKLYNSYVFDQIREEQPT